MMNLRFSLRPFRFPLHGSLGLWLALILSPFCRGAGEEGFDLAGELRSVRATLREYRDEAPKVGETVQRQMSENLAARLNVIVALLGDEGLARRALELAASATEKDVAEARAAFLERMKLCSAFLQKSPLDGSPGEGGNVFATLERTAGLDTALTDLAASVPAQRPDVEIRHRVLAEMHFDDRLVAGTGFEQFAVEQRGDISLIEPNKGEETPEGLPWLVDSSGFRATIIGVSGSADSFGLGKIDGVVKIDREAAKPTVVKRGNDGYFVEFRYEVTMSSTKPLLVDLDRIFPEEKLGTVTLGPQPYVAKIGRYYRVEVR